MITFGEHADKTPTFGEETPRLVVAKTLKSRGENHKISRGKATHAIFMRTNRNAMIDGRASTRFNSHLKHSPGSTGSHLACIVPSVSGFFFLVGFNMYREGTVLPCRQVRRRFLNLEECRPELVLYLLSEVDNQRLNVGSGGWIP